MERQREWERTFLWNPTTNVNHSKLTYNIRLTLSCWNHTINLIKRKFLGCSANHAGKTLVLHIFQQAVPYSIATLEKFWTMCLRHVLNYKKTLCTFMHIYAHSLAWNCPEVCRGWDTPVQSFALLPGTTLVLQYHVMHHQWDKLP